jgi:hypothetical protein
MRNVCKMQLKLFLFGCQLNGKNKKTPANLNILCHATDQYHDKF